MPKIMIVDDEPLFADGLAECLRESSDPEWEVFKAYHGKGALERLERTPVDVLLLDIRMPGMTGLELHREVKARWPRIKVLYLTGHDEFVYVQEALRQGGEEYLLKTEGDEAILEALRKTAKELDEESRREQWASEARERWSQAKSSLRKSLLLELANGHGDDEEQLEAQFAELDLPLRADRPVLLALGQADHWPEEFKAKDRSLVLFAIQNIAQDLLGPSAVAVSVEIDRSAVLWFIQPRAEDAYCERTVYMAEGLLGQVQEKCKTLLKTDVSFAVGDRLAPFPEVDVRYRRLKNLMFRHSGLQNQLFLVDRLPEGAQAGRTEPLKQLDRLRQALERNDKTAFQAVVAEIAGGAEDEGEEISWARTQLYFELVALAVSAIQQLGLKEEVEARFDLAALFRGVGVVSWHRFLDDYRELTELVFDGRSREWERQGMDVVLRIKDFIARNLDADLSLTRIAERVSYHPAYLSRLYKQLSGNNLSDDIAEMRLKRAEQLLADKSLKIHEVGNRVGFDSPRYFTKFFKSHTGLTPQDFRDRANG